MATVDRNGTMRMKILGRFVVFVHGRENPSESEWNAAIGQYRSIRELERMRIIVFTDGGAPNSAQRALLNQVTADREVPMAVITPSPAARAVGTAIRWFNPRFRMFHPHEVDAAFSHIDADAAERQLISGCAQALRRELGTKSA